MINDTSSLSAVSMLVGNSLKSPTFHLRRNSMDMGMNSLIIPSIGLIQKRVFYSLFPTLFKILYLERRINENHCAFP